MPTPANYDFENLSLYGKYHNLASRNLLNENVKEQFKNFQTNEIGFNELHAIFNNLNTL